MQDSSFGPGAVRLLIATTNPGKLNEIRAILAGPAFDLLTLADLSPRPEPEETGATFEENARLKALYHAGATGLLTAAADSGLEIDALDGAPGVHSARYDGPTYPEKFASLYAALDARGAATSAARFICAVALARGSRILYEHRAAVEGEIARPPRGTRGFGYDPIFQYPPYGRTLAEVEPEQKAAVSHRGQAFQALRAWLETAGPLMP
jgi:XTP/dITP diphosphohydrolase